MRIYPSQKAESVERIFSRQSSISDEAERVGVSKEVIRDWVSFAKESIEENFQRRERKQNEKRRRAQQQFAVTGRSALTKYMDETGEVRDRELFPETPGVYVFFHRPTPQSSDLVGSEQFLSWVSRILGVPAGRFWSRLGHLGEVEIELGKAGLDQPGKTQKQDALRDLLPTVERRRMLKEALSELQVSVALYVGQTDSLRRRICQHITSEFCKKAQDEGYHISELSLAFLKMPGTTKVQREAIERILAVTLLAPYVDRAG